MIRTRQALFYLGFRLAMGMIGLLPARVAQRMGEIGGWCAYWLAAGRRNMARRHARRLGIDDPSRHARRMFAAYGRYWAEAFWVRPRRHAEIEAATETEGLDHIRRALAEGRGMILAVPHVGNWEIAAPVGLRLGLRMVAVAEDLPNRWVRDWFVRLRNQLGIGIVLATRGSSVMRELEEVIAGNGAVALLCDRNLRSKGVEVTFFGEATTLPAGPVTLALRTGAPLIPVGSFFLPGGGHRVVVRQPIAFPRDGGRRGALEEGTQRLAEALEELIRTAPDQWHLLQPNWPSDRGE